jgi:hypothetical protein
LAVERNGQGGTRKHFSGKRHIQAATLERGLALRRIEGSFHQYLLLQKERAANFLSLQPPFVDFAASPQ